jgi:radical SAM protein with 4Fe4S-binding SPASM domain
MISISKLYCGAAEHADRMRYVRRESDPTGANRPRRKPIVVWNSTLRCNLRCKHCYAGCDTGVKAPQLDTSTAKVMLEDLAGFGAHVVLFSGGEALLREDVFELAAHARDHGLRVALSTNGTLITSDVAKQLRDTGVAYVGVSLDGLERINDEFRGRPGAFRDALAGMANARDAGLKVGVRFTVSKHNLSDVAGVFDLIRDEGVPRACFYHLVYTGRGSEIMNDDLDHAQTRDLMDLLIDRTAETFAAGDPKEVLTVDNHADGPYVYLRMLREGNPRAAEVMDLLRAGGGNSTGEGIGCISWDGEVYPDQFWRNHSLGNIHDRPFSEIWTDESNELLAKLRDKPRYVHGRCEHCRFLHVCGGNFRARAEAATGDPWACDPACYLTDEEIGLRTSAETAAKES